MTTDPISKLEKFMVSAVVGVTPGNWMNTKIGTSQHMATMLIGRPHLPSDLFHQALLAQVTDCACGLAVPLARRQYLASHPFEGHAADADEVRGEDATCAKRKNGVQCDRGADVDEREENAYHERDHDGIYGNAPSRWHLRERQC